MYRRIRLFIGLALASFSIAPSASGAPSAPSASLASGAPSAPSASPAPSTSSDPATDAVEHDDQESAPPRDPFSPSPELRRQAEVPKMVQELEERVRELENLLANAEERNRQLESDLHNVPLIQLKAIGSAAAGLRLAVVQVDDDASLLVREGESIPLPLSEGFTQATIVQIRENALELELATGQTLAIR